VIAGKIRLGLCLVLGAAASLALPSTAPADQSLSVDSGTISIQAFSQAPKDLITASYDAGSDEYVFTHDIFLESGAGSCHPLTDGPPYLEVRCPAAGITKISIDAAEDNDKILLAGLIANASPNAFASPDLLSVNVGGGSGNDGLSTVGTTARVLPFASASAVGHPVVMNINMGTGNDGVNVGGGTFDATFGGGGFYTGANGDNSVTFGNTSARVTLGDGTNVISLGAGNSKVTVGDGTNTASFGRGNSKFFGGAGVDSVKFKGGNDKFFGGGGNDKAKMGSGRDKAFGGPGDDALKGNAGVDKLIGGGGFDLLVGGGGGDKCLGGGAGAKKVGCEHG
jgi:Ca2+-binding RTX toxin-like protein